MKNTGNIQSKIDSIIKELNTNNKENLLENNNEIKMLIHYSHCIDLLEFLKLYSKVQLNELLVSIAINYDKIGNSQLSLEYIEESLKIIPNDPSVIIFESGLFVTMNKLEEAQKCLLKYKYLIGEDPYNIYIYSSINIVYYYLLEYEENILLKEIDLVEKKFPKYYNNNVILHFIKSKILHKLSEKFNKIDKNRSYLYKRDSIQNKEKALNSSKLDAEYLYKNDINKEAFTKIIPMIYPNFINYKPKALVEYNSNFKSGFGLFFSLFEITKIIKSKILINKKRKLNKNNIIKNNLLKKNYVEENITNSNSSTEISNNKTLNNGINEIKKCKELILSLSKNVWLQRYENGRNNIYIIDNNQIKERKSMKNIDINNINYKLKTNYYIYKGYYSIMNLKDVIIKNITLNDNLKEMKDSFSNELQKDFEQSKNNFNTIMEENFTTNNKNIISITKNSQNKLQEHNMLQKRLIQSTQNKHKIKVNINIKNANKDNPLRMNTEISNSQRYLDKEKIIKINKIQSDNNRKINKFKKDLIYLVSNKILINLQNSSKNINTNDNKKEQKENNSLKSFNKNKKVNNINNIYTNTIFGTKSLYTIRNNKKYYLYCNKYKNKKKIIFKNERKSSKEKNMTTFKSLDKYQEINNEANPSKVQNKNNSSKNQIYINNSKQNKKMMDLVKYFQKKEENSNKINTIINEKVDKTRNFDNKFWQKNDKELNHKIFEKRLIKRNNTNKLQKKIKEKNLTIDRSSYNTISINDLSKNNNKQKNGNQKSSKNLNKIIINNYYSKIKTYIGLKKININRTSENKKRKIDKDNFLKIASDSQPKTVISTPTYKKLSDFNSPGANSKDKEKKSNNNVRYLKIDI